MVEGMVVVHVQYKQRRGNALVIKTTRSKLKLLEAHTSTSRACVFLPQIVDTVINCVRHNINQ